MELYRILPNCGALGSVRFLVCGLLGLIGIFSVLSIRLGAFVLRCLCFGLIETSVWLGLVRFG